MKMTINRKPLGGNLKGLLGKLSLTPDISAGKHQGLELDVKRIGLGIYVVSLAPVAAFGGFIATFSVALGGALALINLALLEFGLARMINPGADPDMARSMAMVYFFFRLFITGGVILGFHSLGWISFPALMAGLSIPLAAITGYFLMARPLKDWYERAY